MRRNNVSFAGWRGVFEKVPYGISIEDNLDSLKFEEGIAYADDVNLIGDIRTIERKADVLISAFKDIGVT